MVSSSTTSLDPEAVTRLRLAIAAVADGTEAGLIYAGDRDLLVLDEGRPRTDGWGVPDRFGQRLPPALSSADLAAARSAIAASYAAAAAAASSDSSLPRGTVFTRPLRGSRAS